jgi:hypothetical protein
MGKPPLTDRTALLFYATLPGGRKLTLYALRNNGKDKQDYVLVMAERPDGGNKVFMQSYGNGKLPTVAEAMTRFADRMHRMYDERKSLSFGLAVEDVYAGHVSIGPLDGSMKPALAFALKPEFAQQQILTCACNTFLPRLPQIVSLFIEDKSGGLLQFTNSQGSVVEHFFESRSCFEKVGTEKSGDLIKNQYQYRYEPFSSSSEDAVP